MSKSNSESLSVMLFAAGLGTRLRPFTNEYPKPCWPLFQIPMGYFLFPYLKQITYQNLVVNTFHLPEKIHELYGKLKQDIQFSDESEFIKGSGGGVKQAASLLKSQTILTANADEVFFTKQKDFLKKAFEQHTTHKNFATLVVMKHPEAGKQFGAIWCDDHGRVLDIGKNPSDPNLKPYHFIGLQFLDASVIDFVESNKEANIFYDVLIHHLKEKSVYIYELQCDWYETGNMSDYKHTKEQIEKNKAQDFYQEHLQFLKQLPLSNLSDLA